MIRAKVRNRSLSWDSDQSENNKIKTPTNNSKDTIPLNFYTMFAEGDNSKLAGNFFSVYNKNIVPSITPLPNIHPVPNFPPPPSPS